jgi:hypothetical protein
MRTKSCTSTAVSVLAGLVALVACQPAQAPHASPGSPQAKQAAGPPPSVLAKARKLHSPPVLASRADVVRFLDWAGAAQGDEQDDARRAFAAVAAKEDVSAGLIDEVERVQRSDYTRALLALAILGEARNPKSLSYLEEFARRPLPQTGTLADGEILEQVLQAQLEGKAVDGLAYANTERSNAAVMKIASGHPSRIVRAEAINAYLWNHGDSAEAKRTLAAIVRSDETIFVDRVRRAPGETAATFNLKLEAFLKTHPEVIAPKPELSSEPSPAALQSPAFDKPPPSF